MLDKELIRTRFTRSMGSYSAMADVQHLVADRLVDMVFADSPGCMDEAGGNPWRRVLEIGCGDGLLTRRIVSRIKPDVLVANDLCDSAGQFVSVLPGVEFIPGDAESVCFPENMDMIISGSTVQWLSDLPAFFARCAASLSPGGVMAFSTFGPDNLKEFSVLEGAGLDYCRPDELERMVSAHFCGISVADEHIVMKFSSPADVLRHLKGTGVTGIRREAWTKGRYSEFVGKYSEKFSCGDGVTLTYHPVWVMAHAPLR
ncbi:MAG: malonyl-ACP O-methyltransferase BioC [Bacteroidales bacterium]|nr:malonyl-ACP O-methyltransferase BioC [Bacteroidales bacterium]